MTDRNQTGRNGKVFSESLLIRIRPFQDGTMPGKIALLRAHCQKIPKIHYSSAEHRKPRCKQVERSSLPCYAV